MARVFISAGLLTVASVARPWVADAGQCPQWGLAGAEALYARGRFEEAAERGQRLQTAEGLTLAAKAKLAMAYAESAADPRQTYEEAARLAEAAIGHAPKTAEPLRLLVVALGNLARTQSSAEVMTRDYPGRARQLIDQARAQEPDSPWGFAILGGWHAELVAALGPVLAEQFYGASASQTDAAFSEALRREPYNPILHFQYARALIQLGARAKAQRQLALSAGLPPRDAFEAIMARRAKDALAALAEGKDALAEKLLEPAS